jgi:putative transposase
MSYRDYKQFAPSEFFHVYNRGNNKMSIFCDDQDYRNFLKRLLLILKKDAPAVVSKMPFDTRIRLTPFTPDTFSIVCYCLMPNHFHFCILQRDETPIGLLMQRLCTSYAKYFNRKYAHVGHVFQDQFSAVHIKNDVQLAIVSAYIHQNPKVAGLVNDIKMWPHSSYQEYITGREVACDHDPVLRLFETRSDYEDFVEDRYDDILGRNVKDDL